jgi:hypothetical protein
MSGTCDRAKRYCDRANECFQIIASSQTPGTGAISADRRTLSPVGDIRKKESIEPNKQS